MYEPSVTSGTTDLVPHVSHACTNKRPGQPYTIRCPDICVQNALMGVYFACEQWDITGTKMLGAVGLLPPALRWIRRD
jgi:hypothetical protein